MIAFNIVKITVDLVLDAVNTRRLNKIKEAKIKRRDEFLRIIEMKEIEAFLDASHSGLSSEEEEKEDKKLV